MDHLIENFHQLLRVSLVQSSNPDIRLEREAEPFVAGGVCRRGVEKTAAAERIPALDESRQVGDGQIQAGAAFPRGGCRR